MKNKLDILERVIALVRPKSYNKIASSVVFGGLLIFARPFWEGPVLWIFGQMTTYKPAVDDLKPAYGLVLVFFGLTYHLLAEYISKLAQSIRYKDDRLRLEEVRDHDREIFSRLSNKVPEHRLKSFLDSAANCREFNSEDKVVLVDAIYFLKQESNRFLNNEIAREADNLLEVLTDTNAWLGANTFYGKENDSSPGWTCSLHPSLNPSKSGDTSTQKRYDKLVKKLECEVDSSLAQYSKFRMTVKDQIAV